MMKFGRASLILGLFLVVAVVLTTLIYGTLDRGVGSGTNQYRAMFTDVSGLTTGDDVRVAGVRVGRVDRIDLVGSQARVTFRLQRDQTLDDSTTAAIQYQDILGQRYLGLARDTQPSGHQLSPGSEIPISRTVSSFDISRLLNGFEPLFSTLDPQQVDNLTNALINAFQGDGGSLLGLVTQTSALAESMAGPDDALGHVIENLNAVVGSVAGRDKSVQTTLQDISQVMRTLNGRQDELIQSVGAIGTTVTGLAGQMNIVAPDLTELVERRPGFTSVMAGDSKERISYLAANTPQLLKGLARVSQSGAYLSGYACDINVSVFAVIARIIPALIRLSSQGNIIQHTPICR